MSKWICIIVFAWSGGTIQTPKAISTQTVEVESREFCNTVGQAAARAASQRDVAVSYSCARVRT